MKKLLLTICLVVFLSTSATSIVEAADKDPSATASVGNIENSSSATVGNIRNVNRNVNTATATTGDIKNTNSQHQKQKQFQVNEGNQNAVSISDNSYYTEIYPTELLNPTLQAPLANKLESKNLHISKSIFKLHRNTYTCTELTRFANPGQFLGILWPEWDNTYHIEIATFAKYKSQRTIRIVPASTIAAGLGLYKIGEAQAYAKDLNKSEHQVMAALAVHAAKAGAQVLVFREFSTPLVKVDSFVVGGGGSHVASSSSIFNGATGIGTSQSEQLTRACIVAELYR